MTDARVRQLWDESVAQVKKMSTKSVSEKKALEKRAKSEWENVIEPALQKRRVVLPDPSPPSAPDATALIAQQDKLSRTKAELVRVQAAAERALLEYRLAQLLEMGAADEKRTPQKTRSAQHVQTMLKTSAVTSAKTSLAEALADLEALNAEPFAVQLEKLAHFQTFFDSQ